VRTLGWVHVRALLASDRRVTAGVFKIARRIWEAGVAGWPVTGRRGGILNITAAAWTAGFQWWRSGDITRTRNVSEYMLVPTVCLVIFWKIFCVRS